jgi:hypothetical protein
MVSRQFPEPSLPASHHGLSSYRPSVIETVPSSFDISYYSAGQATVADVKLSNVN